MASISIRTTPNALMRELNDFLTTNLDAPGTVWPRLLRPTTSDHEARRVVQSVRGLRVLVVGDLTLELPIEVEATRAELMDHLKGPGFGPHPVWKMRRIRVGGFVRHAIDVAAMLGAEVSVCTCLPIPTPARIEAYLDACGADRRLVKGIPGCASLKAVIQCKDGAVAIELPPCSTVQRMDLPMAATREVDAILVDASALADHSPLGRSLSRCLRRSSDKMTVGLRLDQRADLEDFPLIRDSRVWTFLRRRDGLQLAGREMESSSGGREIELVRHLHDRFKIAKVVVQLSAQGAVMMNGIPRPYRVRTCPVSRAKFTPAGDTLLAVTTLSNASGADDKTSLRRGVAAATGQVAGLPLPTSFEELDAT